MDGLIEEEYKVRVLVNEDSYTQCGRGHAWAEGKGGRNKCCDSDKRMVAGKI